MKKYCYFILYNEIKYQITSKAELAIIGINILIPTESVLLQPQTGVQIIIIFRYCNEFRENEITLYSNNK